MGPLSRYSLTTFQGPPYNAGHVSLGPGYRPSVEYHIQMGVPPLGHLLQGPALLHPTHTWGFAHSLYIYGSSPRPGPELADVSPLAGGTCGCILADLPTLAAEDTETIPGALTRRFTCVLIRAGCNPELISLRPDIFYPFYSG